MIFTIYLKVHKLSSGIGLLVVHQMYKEENSHIRPFIVIGNFKKYKLSTFVFIDLSNFNLSSVKNANSPNGIVKGFLPGPVLIGGGIMTALFSLEVHVASLLKYIFQNKS